VTGWRRPTPRWCTDVAVRLLQLGCREEDRDLLPADVAERLVAIAAELDAYGQRLLARSP
jgi:hypothetical protein